MNFFKVSVVTVSLLLVGCGSNGGSTDSGDTGSTEIEMAKTVEEAKTNMKALTAFESLDFSSASPTSEQTKALTNNKLSMEKTESENCNDGGTVTINLSEDEKTLTYTFDKCKNGEKYLDGTMKTINHSATDIEVDYDKFTATDVGGTDYLDINIRLSTVDTLEKITMKGAINQTATSGEINNVDIDLVTTLQETVSESWGTIDGDMAIESKCFRGKYTLETVEKLVEASDGTENTQSGILKINGATYTFENPHVSIKVGDEETTVLQSELEKELESTTCDT